MRVAYRSAIPLIGRSPVDDQLSNPRSYVAQALAGTVTRNDHRKMVESININTRQAALVKPGRRLGGAWIDEFVSAKASVSLCADCERKYGNWHEYCNYEKRHQLEITDCDGCGQELQFCHGWYYSLRAN